jgi:hypothetical protein
VAEAFAFRAVLVPYGPFAKRSVEGVVRTIAMREDQTLENLHEALRLAFGWADPHMYAFWPSGKWWDDEGVRYQTPFELDPDDPQVRSGRIPIAELGLRVGKKLAYLFDFGDEWRLVVTVVERWEAGDDCYPQLVEAEGVVPPQYAPLEDEDDFEA